MPPGVLACLACTSRESNNPSPVALDLDSVEDQAVGKVNLALQHKQNMRRASTSMRTENHPSPAIRSRSVERASQDLEEAVSKLAFDDSERMASENGDDTTDRELHRAMSDPLDAQEDSEQPEPKDSEVSEKGFPTMPRFPVSETRDKNCWSEPPVNIFSVRGPHYFNDKKKVSSGPYLLQARGCDMLLNSESDKSGSVDLEERYAN